MTKKEKSAPDVDERTLPEWSRAFARTLRRTGSAVTTDDVVAKLKDLQRWKAEDAGDEADYKKGRFVTTQPSLARFLAPVGRREKYVAWATYVGDHDPYLDDLIRRIFVGHDVESFSGFSTDSRFMLDTDNPKTPKQFHTRRIEFVGSYRARQLGRDLGRIMGLCECGARQATLYWPQAETLLPFTVESGNPSYGIAGQINEARNIGRAQGTVAPPKLVLRTANAKPSKARGKK